MPAEFPSGHSPVTTPGVLDYDVVIIGAGISGINAAHRLQTQSPALTYVILEARDTLGGTWNLFRYPGIRTDSDMFTFGLPWSPWGHAETMASGEQIMSYLIRSAQSAGIDRHIRYRHDVAAADWNSPTQRWVFQVNVAGEEKPVVYRSRFAMLGTGYYDYETPLQTVIPGIENFQGKVIHPQFWPEDYDYTGKNVVIIGSGATAVTITPAMAEKAKYVTMLQRSPSYIFSLPSTNFLTMLVFTMLPAIFANPLNRLLWIFQSCMTTWLLRTFPEMAKIILKYITMRQLPPNIKWDPHFKPHYNPWEQRLCACRNGDFYAALRSGKADVVTGTIKTITSNSIELESGSTLHPDVIVTATGLKLKFGGGIRFSIDGQKFNLADKYSWMALMLEDVPNLIFITGYEDASWTLGAEVSITLFLRLLRLMEKRKANAIVARLSTPMPARPLINLTSTYVRVANKVLPRAGTGIWGPKVNYIFDMARVKWGNITQDLYFS
ncbi:hypothetical protein GGS21DRAFT_521942 [Xylaria nigripes]|nr:hypothetical protein GGS21DRAFT_521942 [Xylaria nigripes]